MLSKVSFGILDCKVDLATLPQTHTETDTHGEEEGGRTVSPRTKEKKKEKNLVFLYFLSYYLFTPPPPKKNEKVQKWNFLSPFFSPPSPKSLQRSVAP